MVTDDTARTFTLARLADLISQAITDGQITSLAATVIGADGVMLQYLASIGSQEVVRLIVPPERLADLNALRELMIDATPPEGGPSE